MAPLGRVVAGQSRQPQRRPFGLAVLGTSWEYHKMREFAFWPFGVPPYTFTPSWQIMRSKVEKTFWSCSVRYQLGVWPSGVWPSSVHRILLRPHGHSGQIMQSKVPSLSLSSFIVVLSKSHFHSSMCKYVHMFLVIVQIIF